MITRGHVIERSLFGGEFISKVQKFIHERMRWACFCKRLCTISDSGLLRSPQYPQGFSLDKVVRGGNHARVHIFLHYYTLVNKSLFTSYGIFQHIQHVLMWDVNSQLIGNYATTLNNFLKRFFQILWWKTFTTHRDMNESILDVEYLMHGGFGVLGLMVF
jgi:hypothetical protein